MTGLLHAHPVKPARRQAESSDAGLVDIELLHGISVGLIGEQDGVVLYRKIVDAAVTIPGSQFGTMQVLCPAGDPSKIASRNDRSNCPRPRIRSARCRRWRRSAS